MNMFVRLGESNDLPNMIGRHDRFFPHRLLKDLQRHLRLCGPLATYNASISCSLTVIHDHMSRIIDPQERQVILRLERTPLHTTDRVRLERLRRESVATRICDGICDIKHTVPVAYIAIFRRSQSA